jgi:hypothetical protein
MEPNPLGGSQAPPPLPPRAPRITSSQPQLVMPNENETRRYTAQEWEVQRPEIARLWGNSTLEVLVASMKELHGFEAT